MGATKPRWPQPEALRRGQTASRLAVKHATTLDPYLSAGARDRLLVARAKLGDASAAGVLNAQKTATAGKSGTAKGLQDLIMNIRNAVARTKDATDAQRAAVGIGETLSETDVNAILAQAAEIVRNRDILVACGVIPPVVDALSVAATELTASSSAQAGAKDTRSDTTEARTDAHLEIEALVDEISSRGALAFGMLKNAVLAGRFARLVSSEGPTAEDDKEAGDDDAPVVPPPVTP